MLYITALTDPLTGDEIQEQYTTRTAAVDRLKSRTDCYGTVWETADGSPDGARAVAFRLESAVRPAHRVPLGIA